MICLTVVFNILFDLSALVYLALYLGYSGIFFYGLANIEANFFVQSICSKKTAKKEIAISFDDGPADYTLEILEILGNYDIKAAFFCIGKQIASRENSVKKIHQQGHLIGNHSYTHQILFDFFSSSKMLDDLHAFDNLIENLIGLRPKCPRSA